MLNFKGDLISQVFFFLLLLADRSALLRWIMDRVNLGASVNKDEYFTNQLGGQHETRGEVFLSRVLIKLLLIHRLNPLGTLAVTYEARPGL